MNVLLTGEARFHSRPEVWLPESGWSCPLGTTPPNVWRWSTWPRFFSPAASGHFMWASQIDARSDTNGSEAREPSEFGFRISFNFRISSLGFIHLYRPICQHFLSSIASSCCCLRCGDLKCSRDSSGSRESFSFTRGLKYEREPGYFLGSIYINRCGITGLHDDRAVGSFAVWLPH